MPFCPNCRDEFQDWVTVCPDCGAQMVDALSGDTERETSSVRCEKPPDLVHLLTYSYPAQAHLAKAKLESEGIPAFVADEHMVTANWMYSLALGGVKLWVRESDAETALKILDYKEPPVIVEEPGEGCPACRSNDIHYEKYSVRPMFLTWLITALFLGHGGFTFPFRKKKWVCCSCGHQWKEK